MLRMKLLGFALAVVACISQTAFAGRVGGPGANGTIVMSHSRDTYGIWFRGGETARIAVQGDGDTDLDLYVYNGSGQLVASDADDTDMCVVSFDVPQMARYHVHVVNHGSVYNRYRMVTN